MSCWLNKGSANRHVLPFSKRFLWVPTRMETRKTWVKLPLDVFRHRCWKFCPIFSSVFHSILLSLQRKLLKWSIEPGTRLCAWWFYDFCLLHPEDIVNVKKKNSSLLLFNKTFTIWQGIFSCFFCCFFFLKWAARRQLWRPPSTGHVFYSTTSVKLIFSLLHLGQISQSSPFA